MPRRASYLALILAAATMSILLTAENGLHERLVNLDTSGSDWYQHLLV